VITGSALGEVEAVRSGDPLDLPFVDPRGRGEPRPGGDDARHFIEDRRGAPVRSAAS
jgi:hypothetical protein